jgi:hypothetical protein
MHFSFLCLSALALGVLGGCGGESDDPAPLGGGGTSSTSGNGGARNNGGSSGAAERGNGVAPDPATLVELRALEACDVPEPCTAPSVVQLIENYTHNIQTELASCVLGALAQRRPGRYLHRTEAVFSNGNTQAQHVLVVAADGSVAYVRDPSQVFSTPGQLETVIPPDPAQRCTLKPASYFEACLAEVQAATPSDDDAAWACVFGDGTSLVPSRLDWFESCTREAPPRCESPPDAADASAADAGSEGDAGADAAP